MAKQNKSRKIQADEKKWAKSNSEVIHKAVGRQANSAEIRDPVATAGDGSVEAQVSRLGDPRLQTRQRQTLATQIGRVQGNQHLQRVIDQFSPQSDHSFIQRQEAGPVDIQHDVGLVPQPTPVSCWAASLTMVVDFRDSMNHPVADVASQAGMDLTTGYGWPQIQKAVSTWGLREIAPMSALPTWWADMLEAHGPLWIVEVGAPYHAVVLAGMHGDGTPEATEAHVYNPWPPNQGAIEYKTFEDFSNEFGLGAGAGAAIVHA